MQVSGIPNGQINGSFSVLKTANEQQRLAAELIARTVQNIRNDLGNTIKTAPAATGSAESGTIIDIKA